MESKFLTHFVYTENDVHRYGVPCYQISDEECDFSKFLWVVSMWCLVPVAINPVIGANGVFLYCKVLHIDLMTDEYNLFLPDDYISFMFSYFCHLSKDDCFFSYSM